MLRFSYAEQIKHNSPVSTAYRQTFVKVIFPLVMFASVVEIVGEVTGYCYCEHQCCTDPERSCTAQQTVKIQIPSSLGVKQAASFVAFGDNSMHFRHLLKTHVFDRQRHVLTFYFLA